MHQFSVDCGDLFRFENGNRNSARFDPRIETETCEDLTGARRVARLKNGERILPPLVRKSGERALKQNFAAVDDACGYIPPTRDFGLRNGGFVRQPAIGADSNLTLVEQKRPHLTRDPRLILNKKPVIGVR